MRVLLLYPPGPNKMVGQEGESLGLAYIAAVLRRDGHEVEILDANSRHLGIAEAVNEVVERDFDCLGVTAMHEYRNHVIPLIRAVRGRKRNEIIVVGGYLPTLDTEQFLAACPEVDFVIRGEAEISASDVFGRIDRNEDWRSALGVAYRKDNEVIINPLPPLIQDLDTLPFPARDSLLQLPSLSRAMVAGSRDCFHRCSFCCVHSFFELQGGKGPRLRSPENIVDEIESVISSTGRKQFIFVDDDFIGPGPRNRERALKVGQEIKARKLGISFTIETRADEVDEEILQPLKEVGLTGVFLGIESGVQRQLDTYNKRVTVEQNRRAAEVVRGLDLDLKSGLMIFDPYTTMDELTESMQFLRETELYKSAALESKVTLYRGATLTEKVRQDGLLVENGLELSYHFKDRQVGLLWPLFKAGASCSRSLRWLTQRLRRDKA